MIHESIVRRASRPAGADDRGSAVVDFALVGGLVALVFAGVLQLTLAQHVRNTLVDCAAEGARYAALADRTGRDAAELDVRCAAAAIIAVSMTVMRHWVDGGGTEDLAALYDRQLTVLFEGLRL